MIKYGDTDAIGLLLNAELFGRVIIVEPEPKIYAPLYVAPRMYNHPMRWKKHHG